MLPPVQMVAGAQLADGTGTAPGPDLLAPPAAEVTNRDQQHLVPSRSSTSWLLPSLSRHFKPWKEKYSQAST